MVVRRLGPLALTLGIVAATGSTVRADSLGTATSSSSPVSFATGNVEADMPSTPGSGVYVVPGSGKNAVSQASWITQAGQTTGWNIKDMRFQYDKSTDTMNVGLNFWSIAGSVTGAANSTTDPNLIASGGSDPGHIGGRGSITVALASDADPGKNDHSLGAPIIVAGVPEYKSSAGAGIDGFTVSSYAANGGIESSYGKPLGNAAGVLAYDPSSAHPGFEFTISHFSKIPGLNAKTGFWVQAYAGSPDDVAAGEDTIGWVRVPIAAAQLVPEPSTLVVWTAILAGAAWQLRRARRPRLDQA